MADEDRRKTVEDPRESKLHKWRGLILAVVLIVAVLTGLVVRNHVRVRLELARIRAAGEPVTPDDLARMYAVPEGENDTTELWLGVARQLEPQVMRYPGTKSFVGLPFVDSGSPEPPLPGQSWTDQSRSVALFEELEECLVDLHEAAKEKGPAAFISSFDDAHNILLTHAQDLRSASKLLRLEARIGAHDGDEKASAESIHAIFAIGRALSREPLVVTHLVRLACDASAREEVEDLLSVVDFADADLARFQEGLRSADYDKGLYRAMLGERVIGILTFRDPSSAGLSTTQSMAHRLFGREDMLRYLQVQRQLVASAQLPFPEGLNAVREIGRSIQISKRDNRGKPPSGIRSWFQPSISVWGSASLWGSITPPFERTARALALNRAADAAIAVERFRRREGRLPGNLQETVPEFLPSVPIDPFSGDAMRYAALEDEFLVYSVGVNGVDDGGRTDGIDVEHPLFDNVEKEPADFVFRVRRVRVPEHAGSGTEH